MCTKYMWMHAHCYLLPHRNQLTIIGEDNTSKSTELKKRSETIRSMQKNMEDREGQYHLKYWASWFNVVDSLLNIL